MKNQKFTQQRVIVGMSGGVDSSVAAWLLKQQKYDVIGLFMQNWDDDHENCSSRNDWIDVLSVADIIGIDVETVNFTTEYKELVFKKCLVEYSIGSTPNPDILCNTEIKFNVFLNYAMKLDAKFIATGHYARIFKFYDTTNTNAYKLYRSIDNKKDQSYFLYQLNQKQLSHTIFPLGSMLKTQVRRIAAEIGLPNAKKKDSTGICFIGEQPFRKFLSRYLPTNPGPIKTNTNVILGQHIGLAFYTIGQRKGLGIGGCHNGNGEAWFVTSKDILTNTLYVVQGHDHPSLFTNKLQASSINWINNISPKVGLHLGAKIRYSQLITPCTANVTSKYGQNNYTMKVFFKYPQWAVTPGQSVVLYNDDECLGGGIISLTK